MFEDKRFKNDTGNNSDNFFMPDNSIGLKDGNDNLNFGEETIFRKPVRKTEDIKKPKNKIFLKLFLVLLVLSLIVSSGYFICKQIFNNPYNVYKNVINYGFNYLDSKLNEFKSKSLDYDIDKDILSSTGSFSIDSNLLENYKGYLFKYKVTTDLSKKMIDSNVIISKDNKNILDINGYVRDEQILINSKDIYNKYLQVGTFQNIDFSFNKININDGILNDILKVVKNSLINDLDKNKMSTKKTSIKIQNKNINVISNNFKLNSDDVKNIYINIIEALINDNNVIDGLADMLNLRKAEIKDKFQELKNNEIILNSFKSMEFVVYTKGINKQAVGIKVLYDNKEIINYTNYKNNININIGGDNSPFLLLKNDVETKINYNDNNYEGSIVITKENDKTKYVFSLETEKLEFEGSVLLEVKRVANKKITISLVLDSKGKNDKDNFNINLKFDNVTQVGGTIQNIPKNNIVNFKDLNDLEKNEISKRVEGILHNLPFKDLWENDSSINYCDVANDCECFGSICTCKYLDKFGIEQSINCLNKGVS